MTGVERLLNVFVDHVIHNGDLDGHLLKREQSQNNEDYVLCEADDACKNVCDLGYNVIIEALFEDQHCAINDRENVGDYADKETEQREGYQNHNGFYSGSSEPSVFLKAEDEYCQRECCEESGKHSHHIKDEADETQGDTKFGFVHN